MLETAGRLTSAREFKEYDVNGNLSVNDRWHRGAYLNCV